MRYLTFFSLVYLQKNLDVHCRTWFVSQEGADAAGCGTEDNSCSSLSFVLNATLSGDHVILQFHKNSKLHLERCGSFVLKHSLSIEGIHPTTLSCYSTKNQTSLVTSPLIDIFNDAHVNFTNILFVESKMNIRNARVEFNSCRFTQFAILATEPKVLQLYGDKTTKRREYETGDTLLKSMCLYVSITIRNTTFSSSGVYVDTHMDTFVEFGIQIICKATQLVVEEAIFTSHLVYVISLQVNIEMHNTLIHGAKEGVAVANNFAVIPLTQQFDVTLYNVTFQNNFLSDLLVLLIINRYYTLAAFMVDLRETTQIPSHHNQTLKGRLEIDNCHFISNHRAISLNLPNINYSATITNSVFEDNQSDGDGGAIHVTSETPYGGGKVKIDNCSFVLNKAGVLPFQTGFPNCRNRRLISNILFTDCFYTDDHIFSVTMCASPAGTNNTECFLRTTHLEIAGSGGAIFSKHSAVEISGCSFSNNTAAKQGGAITSLTSAVRIGDCNFNGPFVVGNQLDGSVIASFGTMILENCDVYVKRSSIVSLIYHEQYQIRNSGKVSNITIICPVNSMMHYFNSSRTYFDSLVASNSEYYEFEVAWYLCLPCGKNRYSLSSGSFTLHNGRDRYGTLQSSVNSVKCHDCPFGGTCNSSRGIASEPNYFGLVTDEKVRFYLCPVGYCCSEPDCEGYNVCTENRGGVLCGRCSTGYSESVTSTKCIPNEECHLWNSIMSLGFTILIYALFLLFHKDLKTFLFSSPRRKKKNAIKIFQNKVKALATVKSALNNWPKDKIQPENMKSQSTQTDKSELKGVFDEGAIFLLLMCYYFQDVPLFLVQGPYSGSDSGTDANLKKWISAVFKLQLNIMDFVHDSCAFPDCSPVGKAFFKVVYIPVLLLLLFTLVLVSVRLSIKYPLNITLRKLADKAIVGLTMYFLLSYQTASITMFRMIQCVKFGGHYVLFLDGNVQCFTWWQYLCALIIIAFILPFGIFLAIAPKYVKSGHVTILQFILGCLTPLFASVVYIIRTCWRRFKDPEKRCVSETKSVRSDSLYSSHVNIICTLLQGPYKETQKHILQFRTQYCWTGVLFVRRLLLMTTYTFVLDPLIKMSIMSFIIFAYMINTVYVKPCKGRIANLAEIFSSAALLILSVINLVKAAFETAQYRVKQETVVLKVIMYVEDSLTLYIPFIFASVILLLFLLRTIQWVSLKCHYTDTPF